MHRYDPSCLKGRVPLARALWTPPTTHAAEERPRAGLRMHLIERIRQEIAAGMYDTDEKWELALERLFDDMSKR